MDNNGQLLENHNFYIVFSGKCVFASIDRTENIILLSNPLDSSVYSVDGSIRGMWTVIQELEENLYKLIFANKIM